MFELDDEWKIIKKCVVIIKKCSWLKRFRPPNQGGSQAPFTPATLSKQHSTLLLQTATASNEFIVKFRLFDKFECFFDIVAVFGNNVAGFGNNVERNFVLSTMISAYLYCE